MLTGIDSVEVVAELDDVDSLHQVINDTQADVVLLDLELKGNSGVESLRLLREHSPDIRVIVYTAHDDEEHIVGAAELGMEGYLLKGCGQQELVDAIVAVHSGGTALESKVAGTIMQYMNQGRSASLHNVQFSKREKQVLQELAAGRMNRDIGANLFISESTVKFHVHAILTKLGASNRTEAVSMAHKFGFIEFSGNAGDSN
jgi:two-component system NarL family response regulator